MRKIYQLNDRHIDDLHKLYKHEWWTKDRTIEEVELCIDGSQVIVGIEDDSENLIAFARVVTDFVFKAFIFDVIVHKKLRKTGLGNEIMHMIHNHPLLKSVPTFELYCLPEMCAFYEEYGYSSDVNGLIFMRKPLQ